MKKETQTSLTRKLPLLITLWGVFFLLSSSEAAPQESVFTKSLGFPKKAGGSPHSRGPRRKGKLFGGLHEPEVSKASEAAKGTSSEDETSPTGLVGFGFDETSSPANPEEAQHALYAAALGFSLSVGLLDRDETAIVTPGTLDGVEWATKALRRAVKSGGAAEKDKKQLVEKTETILRDISRVEKMFSSWESLEQEIRGIGEILAVPIEGTRREEPESNPMLEIAERLQRFTIADLVSVTELPFPSLPLGSKTESAQLGSSEAPDSPVSLSAPGEPERPTVESSSARDESGDALPLPSEQDSTLNGHLADGDGGKERRGSTETDSTLSGEIDSVQPPTAASASRSTTEQEEPGPQAPNDSPDSAARSREVIPFGPLSEEALTVANGTHMMSSVENQGMNSENAYNQYAGQKDTEKDLERTDAKESAEERNTGDESAAEKDASRQSAGDENSTNINNSKVTGVSETSDKPEGEEISLGDDGSQENSTDKPSTEENPPQQNSRQEDDGKSTNDEKDEVKDASAVAGSSEDTTQKEGDPENSNGEQNSVAGNNEEMDGAEKSEDKQNGEKSGGQEHINRKEDDEREVKEKQNGASANEGATRENDTESVNATENTLPGEKGTQENLASGAGSETVGALHLPGEKSVLSDSAEITPQNGETEVGDYETPLAGKRTDISTENSGPDSAPEPKSEVTDVQASAEQSQPDNSFLRTTEDTSLGDADLVLQSEETSPVSQSAESQALKSADDEPSARADHATVSSVDQGNGAEALQQHRPEDDESGVHNEGRTVTSSAAEEIHTKEPQEESNGVREARKEKLPTEESGFLERPAVPTDQSTEAEEASISTKHEGTSADRQEKPREAAEERAQGSPSVLENDVPTQKDDANESAQVTPTKQESVAQSEGSSSSKAGESTAEVGDTDDHERHQQAIIGTAAINEKNELDDTEQSPEIFTHRTSEIPGVTFESLSDSLTNFGTPRANRDHSSAAKMTSDSAPAASQQGVGRLEVESSDDHNVRPFLAVQPQMQSQTKQQRPTINVTEEKAGTPAGRKHGDMSGPTVTTATPTVEKGKDEQNGAEAEAVVLEDLPENNSKRRKRDGAQRPASELEKRGGKQGAAKDQQEAFLSRDKTAVAGTRVGSSIKPEISGDDRTTKTSEGTQGKKEIVPNSVPPTDSEVVQILKSKGLDELMNAKTFDDLRRILGPYMKVTLKDALAFKELSEKLKESGVQEAEIRGMMATEAKPWKTIAASIGLSEKSTETLERCLSQLVAK